jgi:transcription initiation factor IIE alpha subunit
MSIYMLRSATRGSKLSLGHQMTSQQTQHYTGASLRYNTQHKTTEDLKKQSMNTKKRCAETERDREGSGFFGLL